MDAVNHPTKFHTASIAMQTSNVHIAAAFFDDGTCFEVREASEVKIVDR